MTNTNASTETPRIYIDHGPLCEASLSSFMCCLSEITINEDGQILSSKKEIKKVIKLGKKATLSLSGSIVGLGIVMAYGEIDNRQIHRIGWLTSHIGETISHIYKVSKALKKCKKGGKWPMKQIEDSAPDISQLLWSLPFYPHGKDVVNTEMAKILGNVCRAFMEVEALHIDSYCCALDIAANSGEIDCYLNSAIRISTEWTAFFNQLQDINNSCEHHTYREAA